MSGFCGVIHINVKNVGNLVKVFWISLPLDDKIITDIEEEEKWTHSYKLKTFMVVIHIKMLHGISFDVYPKEIIGLIGLNVAGKSTTIKHVMGLIDPKKGQVSVNEQTFQENPKEYRNQIAYIPEMPILYEELTLYEHLRLTAMAYGLSEKVFEERLPPLLKAFRLEKRLKWFPVHFSKGMRQKVMSLCAFLIEPPLYVVDEPFVGLDPLGIQSYLDLD